MEDFILEVGLCLIENIIIYMFFNSLLKRKFHSLFPLISTIFIITVINYLSLKLMIILKMALSIICILISLSILYKDKLVVKATYIIVSLYTLCIIDIILGNIMSLMLSKDIAYIFFTNFSYRLVFSLIVKIVDVLIFILLYKMLYKTDKNTKYSFWTLLLIVVFAFLAIATVFLQLYPNIEQNSINTVLYLTLALLFFAMSLIIIYFFTELNKGYQRDSKLLLFESNFSALQEQIAVQQQNSNNVKKLRHDMKSHLINIRALINNGNLSDAVTLLDKTAENVNCIQTETINTGNSFVDAILLSKAALCRDKQIDFNYSIAHLEYISIDVVDLSSLLSNLLDNAIESAIQTEKPFVRLTIVKYNAYYTICVENSYKGRKYIKESAGILISTKINKSLHGYGTQIISDIAQKYDGNYSWEAQDDKFVSTVLIKI